MLLIGCSSPDYFSDEVGIHPPKKKKLWSVCAWSRIGLRTLCPFSGLVCDLLLWRMRGYVPEGASPEEHLACIYLYIYVYMYICICIYIYIYIYI